MIILIKRYGNHSNRLLQNLHFEAFCKEHNIKYMNPSFKDMYKYYCDPCKVFKGIRIFYLNKFIWKKLLKYKFVKSISFDNESYNYKALCTSPLDILVSGFHFRAGNLVMKYQEYFIKKYSLRKKYIKDNQLLKTIIELKHKLIIGVHIRRGDYKDWQGGIYYFNDDVYLKYIENMGSSGNIVGNGEKC